MAENGISLLGVPDEFDGVPADMLTQILIIEELARMGGTGYLLTNALCVHNNAYTRKQPRSFAPGLHFFMTPRSGQEKHFTLSSLNASSAPSGDSPRLDCIIHDASLSI